VPITKSHERHRPPSPVTETNGLSPVAIVLEGMRMQRMSLVQSLRQYLYVHRGEFWQKSKWNIADAQLSCRSIWTWWMRIGDWAKSCRSRTDLPSNRPIPMAHLSRPTRKVPTSAERRQRSWFQRTRPQGREPPSPPVWPSDPVSRK
jgi:hypothetical protein